MNRALSKRATRFTPASDNETDLNSSRVDRSCVSRLGETHSEHWEGRRGEDDGAEEDVSSEGFLRRVTGEEDLGSVLNLVLTVDTNVTQVINKKAPGFSKSVTITAVIALCVWPLEATAYTEFTVSGTAESEPYIGHARCAVIQTNYLPQVNVMP